MMSCIYKTFFLWYNIYNSVHATADGLRFPRACWFDITAISVRNGNIFTRRPLRHRILKFK